MTKNKFRRSGTPPSTNKKDRSRLPLSREYFFASLIYLMIIPLAPLTIEMLLHEGVIKEETIYLVTSMYAIAVGTSSNSQTVFNFAVMISVVFALAFGFSNGTSDASPIVKIINISVISMISLVHVVERFSRHVLSRDPFPDYMKSHHERLKFEILEQVRNQVSQENREGEE